LPKFSGSLVSLKKFHCYADYDASAISGAITKYGRARKARKELHLAAGGVSELDKHLSFIGNRVVKKPVVRKKGKISTVTCLMIGPIPAEKSL
jgi:hypothetical protein